jgi:cytochrome oxidase Cu insertion factor (SCO1/SenC/PrrC family)
MTFLHSPSFLSARSLGAAGLLVVLVGCGTNPTTSPGPPETSQARPVGGSPVLPAKAETLAVGARAPAFALEDQNGRERTLEDFLKKGKVALVFYRSAKW